MAIILSATAAGEFKAHLTDEVVTVEAANDFAGLRLRDRDSVDMLPTKNLKVVWAEYSLDVTVLGFTSNTVSTLDLALGTTTASATTFDADQQNLMQQHTLSGGAATGSVSRHSYDDAAPGELLLDDSSANAVFLNIKGACTAAATVTVSGTITLKTTI